MRKLIGFFALAASLLLAPVSAFAQNTSNLAATDKVLVTRVDANGVGTPGAVVVGQVFNGTGIGYSAGTTAVICAGYAGQITMFSAAGSATAATFTVTDSKVISTDTVEIMQASGTNLYTVIITAVANGSFNVTFFTTGGTATDAPVLNFTVIHAATS
jgi:hypothetical protein